MAIRIDVDVEKLAYLIASRGYSLRGFSDEIGASSSYMSQVIRGVRTPSPQLAKRICDHLNIQFDELFTVTIERSEQPEQASETSEII